MALDPIVVGCDWQATLITDPTLGLTAQTVVDELTGATVVARLVDSGGVVRATGNASVTSATERKIEVAFDAVDTRLIAPGVGFILDVRVLTVSGHTRAIQVREKLEVRPYTVGVR